MRQHPTIIPTMESQWQRAEKESFLLDIPSSEKQKTVGLDNLGKLSSIPQSGKDRPANYRGLEQELPQYIIQALRYNGEINNDEMIAKFISSEKKRSINSKVGTYLDQRGMIQALAILEYQQNRYDQMVKRKTLIKCQQLHAETKSMRGCNMMPIALFRTSIYMSPSGYSFGGLATCDSPLCPRCSRKRSHERQQRIAASIQGAIADGKRAYFVTLTMKRSSDIKAQIKHLKKAWKGVQNKLDRQIKKKLGGTYATARAMDVTFKLSGRGSQDPYHLHLHCVIIIDLPKFSYSKISTSSVYSNDYITRINNIKDSLVSEWIKSAWCKVAKKSDRKGQDIERVKSPKKLASYCAKMAGLAMELTSIYTKQGKKKNTLSLAQLMEEAMTGNQYAIHIYKSYLKAMYKIKTISFSKNWDSYAPEIEEEEEKEEPAPIATIPSFWWDACKWHLDDIGLRLWKSIYLEDAKKLDSFLELMSIESVKEFEDWMGLDCSRSEELHGWLES